ncbi:hypothetical protein AGOR_G00140130 [Albula goreensis]|uniref:Methyltransferase type 11 domain-containing protein n=1 Tax=Albula goreensis TaxID=1534307 RepID=A0A8T3DBG2_9TELE|nr:hypothetical protein AGOR_G00140130 [Albula goreensis]
MLLLWRLKMVIEKISKQLGQPTKSLLGWMVKRSLIKNNRILEENAVKLCAIQPTDTVLELGFGPGVGLEAAAQLLSSPEGKLIGVDYSEYMYKVSTQRMKHLIASGKVTLHQCSVDAMPLPDSSVDKVFHCNCYYFWPDLREGAAEIHRVMKPGGLMVTTLNLTRLSELASQKVIPGDNWRPENYIDALRATGFIDVGMEDRKDRGLVFQVIFATVCKWRLPGFSDRQKTP